MKPLFIVNTHAGKSKTKETWKKIQYHLQRYGLEYEVYYTSQPKAAIEAAKQAEGVYTHVIAVGGDGTIHEVVNGLTGQNTVLGVIPTGTGNDFARMLNIPKDPSLAIKTLMESCQTSIDLLEMNNTYIASAIGIGVDGAVAEDINRKSWKKRIGAFGYVISMLKLIFTFPPFTLHLDIDEQPLVFQNCWLVAVGNSKFYGGGMKICPYAQYDDGLLDICIVHNLSQVELLRIFPTVFSGKHVFYPNVVYLKGYKVRVQTDPIVPVHGDGEILGKTPSEIIVRPKSLTVIHKE
jgi:diacylglycerol kinase (ATP)